MKETINLNKESKEKINPEIVLHFFRHSKKEKANVPDEFIHISEEGRKLAKENSFKDVDIDQSVAYGSPRIRTQETALFMMAGEKDEITGDETLEELKENLNGDLEFGSKVGINKKLNFTDDFESPLGEKMYKAYMNGNYLDALVNNSDRITEETNDTTQANFSAKALEVAKIIKKYVKILPRWEKLVDDKTKGYNQKLERFFGTHSSIPEAFILKVLKLTNKDEELEEYIKVNKNEIDYLKGFDAVIEEDGGEVALTIFYDLNNEKKEIKISSDILDKIIE